MFLFAATGELGQLPWHIWKCTWHPNDSFTSRPPGLTGKFCTCSFPQFKDQKASKKERCCQLKAVVRMHIHFQVQHYDDKSHAATPQNYKVQTQIWKLKAAKFLHVPKTGHLGFQLTIQKDVQRRSSGKKKARQRTWNGKHVQWFLDQKWSCYVGCFMCHKKIMSIMVF